MNRYKTFASYVLPAVLSFALSGVYAIVDGFFIGNCVGDIGLSAINIAYPVTALIQAVGTGIGMGGAVLYSLRMAQGQAAEADDQARGTMLYLAAGGLLLTVLLFPLITPILRLMGASGELLSLGRGYLRFIIAGAVFQTFGTGIVPLIRNHNSSFYAMICMTAGFLTNIALDYVFVWMLGWGVTGAAIATVIGQSVTMAGGSGYLLVKKIPCWGVPKRAGSVLRSICRVGLAPFGITLCPMISLLFMNKASLSYGGEAGVACYACVAYITTIIYMVLQGVGDGSQPLMSRYHGTGSFEEVRRTRTCGYVAALCIGACCMLLIFLVRHGIGSLFGASELVSSEVAGALPVFLAGVPFIAVSRVTTAAFYATGKNGFSYILVYTEPAALFFLLLLFPPAFGQNGVWWSMVLSQILAAVIAIGLKADTDRKASRDPDGIQGNDPEYA